MFGINKKIDEAQKDPKKAIDQADAALNKGLSGFMTKAFMGKGFQDKMNQSLNTAKNAVDYNNLGQTGLPAIAEVLSIEDTGTLVNYNPVVRMKLKGQPQYGIGFENTVETMVSKIAVPRVGDKLNIKYNAVNTSEIVIV